MSYLCTPIQTFRSLCSNQSWWEPSTRLSNLVSIRARLTCLSWQETHVCINHLLFVTPNLDFSSRRICLGHDLWEQGGEVYKPSWQKDSSQNVSPNIYCWFMSRPRRALKLPTGSSSGDNWFDWTNMVISPAMFPYIANHSLLLQR